MSETTTEPQEITPEPAGLWPGDFAQAKVTKLGEGQVEVTFGDALIGRFDRREATRGDGSLIIAEGEEVEILLDEPQSDGSWAVSMEKAEKVRIYDRLVELSRKHARVEGVITRVVRGGFSVDIGVRAFLPAQESGIRRSEVGAAVGRTVRCAIQRFDVKDNVISLTRRKVAEQETQARRAERLAELQVGEVIEGWVSSLTKFGAFVDLGGVDGLIHVGELSWGRVDRPEDVVSEGDSVRVKVLEIDRERGRIGLSLRALQDNPWQVAADRFPAGTRTSGRVTNITDFGAFIEIAAGIEGLAHISELSWDREITHAAQVLEVDQEVEVLVLGIDTTKERASLSLKQLEDNPLGAVLATLVEGAIIEGAIVRIEEYGVFIEVAPGVSGLAHVSDMSWTRRISNPADLRDFTVGQPCAARILEIDRERGRIKLGIKQLEADPWEALEASLQPGAVAEVTITRIAPFGAFAALAEGVEGLIHISEVAVDRVQDLTRELSTGQTVKVKVLSADRKSRKIALSIKAFLEEGEEGMMRSYTDDDDAQTSLGDKLKEVGLVEGEEPAAG